MDSAMQLPRMIRLKRGSVPFELISRLITIISSSMVSAG